MKWRQPLGRGSEQRRPKGSAGLIYAHASLNPLALRLCVRWLLAKAAPNCNPSYDMLHEPQLRNKGRALPLRPCAYPGAAVRRGFNFPSPERRAHRHQHRLGRRITAIAGRGPRPRLAHRRASPQARPVQAPAGRNHRAGDEREALSTDRPFDSRLTNASTRRIVRLERWLVERFGSYMIKRSIRDRLLWR